MRTRAIVTPQFTVVQPVAVGRPIALGTFFVVGLGPAGPRLRRLCAVGRTVALSVSLGTHTHAV